ncbi:hypothetical protein KBD08_04685, partial [Candidatus Babeliales bacterium]|nr:hypothetical protein [Candidatus Babeliales bacterium]
MQSCCNHQKISKINLLFWFLISACGNPINFLLIMLFPRDWFLSSANHNQFYTLNVSTFFLFALCSATVWYMLLTALAYIRGNTIHIFFNSIIVPQTPIALFGQLCALAIGYSNVYFYAKYGTQTNVIILALLFLGICVCSL